MNDTRVLVTGAGGLGAVGLIKGLAHLEVHAADMSAYAPGLYLVPGDRRVVVPPGDDPELVTELLEYCVAKRIQVLVSTVACELETLAGARERFARIGTELLLAPSPALVVAQDRWALARRLDGVVATPRMARFDARFDASQWSFPLVMRSRSVLDDRPDQVILDRDELASVPRDGELLVTPYLPGGDYTVDVLADRHGRVVSAVVRECLAGRAGACVNARTVHAPELVELATLAVEAVGITWLAHVRISRAAFGTPYVVDVVPRVSDAVGLTVAAGVDMPALAVAHARGAPLPAEPPPYAEVAMVRTMQEHFVPARDVEAARQAPWLPAPLPAASPRVLH